MFAHGAGRFEGHSTGTARVAALRLCCACAVAALWLLCACAAVVVWLRCACGLPLVWPRYVMLCVG
eukprot:1332772-Alexandrium_andersonii.AAC.1